MPEISEEHTVNEMIKNLKTERHVFKTRMDWEPEDYNTVVDESVLNINFTPDVFQKQAFYFLSKKDSVFVSAHTSSGKTLVAEYAIGLSLKNASRVIYTSPIKALSNQKFFDFKQKFPDVGLITGDVQVNPTAKCLIMTTEILRNLIYKNSDILGDTEYVIFDEVHYINDEDRGVVWEECIIMLPKHISLVMLSATIPNSLEFAEWVGRTKETCIYVISTTKRAVPLEFVVYCDANVFSIESGPKKSGPVASNFPMTLQPFNKNIKATNRFRINDLGNFVNNKRLVPAIFFVFSKRMCEEYGKSLQLLDLTSPQEKDCIVKFLDSAMDNLREEDRQLPQIRFMREQVYRGVAIHHGALLPFVKECVEILFSENLIKILVATETFAMGVNMPAKCCAFLSLTKIDNGSFRYLNTSEFIQMSGRAGRRGMDKVGTVIIADSRSSDLSTITRVISGIPTKLNSKFKLSFALILTAIITNVEVENLMRSSFKEHSSQKSIKRDMERLSELESKTKMDCEQCSDFLNYFSELRAVTKGATELFRMNLKVGDSVILKSNAVVRITSIQKGGFSFVNSEVRLTSVNIFTEIADLQEKDKASFIFDHPIMYRRIVDNGTASFEDVMFYVKNNTISFDFTEINMKYISTISELKEHFDKLVGCSFLRCDKLHTHYLKALEKKVVFDEINDIKKKYSRESLALMTEYNARVQFLKKYSFVGNSIGLKGRVAAEIRTVNDVLVTEMIFNNELEQFGPSEVIAVFSSMLSEDTIEDYKISPELEAKIAVIQKYQDELTDSLDVMGIPRFNELNLSLVQAVYDWCSGMQLGNIVMEHRVQEGSFVRLLLRLDECCREMANVSSIIGDEKIGQKFSEASALMRRDIVFLPSLYIG